LAEALVSAREALAQPARLQVLYVRDMDLLAAAPWAAKAPAAPTEAVVRSALAPTAAVPPAVAASAPARAASQAAAPAASEPAAAASDVALETSPDKLQPPETASAPLPDLALTKDAAPSVETAALPAIETPTATGALAGALAGAVAAPAAGASSAEAVAAFEWPVSTRLSYRLTGQVRGEVHGDAQVEWLREGSRYQVHLDVTVGLHVAPMMTRRMSSDGQITPQGLSPRRYDQDTKVGMGDRRRALVQFEQDGVRLANGQWRERPPGTQDTASQFIQLIYLFSTRPQAWQAGDRITLPLALPTKLSLWTYEVQGDDIVYTDFGPIAAVHLKPRREGPTGGDLSAEIWLAPQLRYLPARIRIHQDETTYIDLKLSRKPEMAGN
jgi:hypothetical protein